MAFVPERARELWLRCMLGKDGGMAVYFTDIADHNVTLLME